MSVEIVPQPKKLKFTGRWLEFDGFENLPGFLSREFQVPTGRWRIEKTGGRGIGLNVSEKVVEIWGDERICYASLIQLIRQKPGFLPEVQVEEEFKFDIRCFHLDIARGGVPKPEYFERLLRWLFLLKYNFLAVYVEDLFPWRSYPQIGVARGRLTGEEWVRITGYAGKLGLEVFPSLELLGHMENILSLPEFRGFSEWHRPEEGCLDVSNREARRFALTLLEDALDQTESRYIHVGGDETWALGRGRSLDLTGRFEGPRLYLEFYEEVVDRVVDRGKTPIVWGDMLSGMYLRQAEAALWKPLLESDLWAKTLIANWDYSPKPVEHFKRKIELFADRGLRQIVCPGLANWRRYYPCFDTALSNLKNFLWAGREAEVEGFMVTAWGDDGEECLFSFLEPLILAAMEYGEGEGRWVEKWVKLTGESEQVLKARILFGRREVSENVKPTILNPISEAENLKVYDVWRRILGEVKDTSLPRDLEFIRTLLKVGLRKIEGKASIADFLRLSSLYSDLWLEERKPQGLERVYGRFWSAASQLDLQRRLTG